MEAPPIDTVYQAISALYDNPNASEKEKASIWLADVQKSIHSWKIADELLQHKKDMNSYYFAAQTMHSKVQHNLSELPAESLDSLKNSLIAHLKSTTPDTGSAILTQLSLALVDLMLQVPVWKNCLGDIISTFSNANDYALLELLTVLPQEIDSSSLKLGENRREEIKAELRSNTDRVTLFLSESILSTSKKIVIKIVKCMTSWIQIRAVNLRELDRNAVIAFCMMILQEQKSSNNIHEAASDCICALLHCLGENNNDDNVERLVFDSVAALENHYFMAVGHEEEEKAANYARVFTELAESFLHKIISSAANGETHFAMRSLELALICVGHHEYDIAEITFNLWYRLSEEVFQRDQQALTDVFKPCVERLLAALARHCQCEPDETHLPASGDDFYDFRSKVMELIKDVVFIVGSSAVFRQVCATLEAQAAASWEQTEAVLFVMQAIAKNIMPDEDEYVPKILAGIMAMDPGTHLGVRETCLRLVGELADWVDAHPPCAPGVFRALLQALQEPPLAEAAAQALQSICSRPHAARAAPTGALVAACGGGWSPRAADLLMRAAAAALAHLPPDQLEEALQQAVSFQMKALEATLSAGAGGGGGGGGGGPGDPVPWLDRAAALFRDLQPEAGQRCVPRVLEAAWPVLYQVMERHGDSTRVTERWCRCVRFALRSARAAAAPLCPELARAVAALYAQRAHPAFLYLSSILVDELAGTASCAGPLTALLGATVPRALAGLGDAEALRDHPDTVDDLFRLSARYLQRLPAAFLSSPVVGPLLTAAGAAAALDHRDANCSVMKLLYELVRAANHAAPERREPRALAAALVAARGEELTAALLAAAATSLHAYMLGEVAEVLLELVVWMRAAGVDWLAPALRRLPREGTAVATEQQCAQFHQYAMRAEKCKELTQILRDFVRLYR